MNTKTWTHLLPSNHKSIRVVKLGISSPGDELHLIYYGPSLVTSAYTEAYNVCSVAAAVSAGDVSGEMTGDEDQGRTSEEEEGAADSNYERQVRILDTSCECFSILKK